MEKHRVRGDARILKNLLTFLNSEIGVQIANIRVPISLSKLYHFQSIILEQSVCEKPAG